MSQNQPNRGPSPSMPRWVKVFVVLIIVLILVVIVVHLMGFRFEHGTGGMLFHRFVHLTEYPVQQL